MKAFTWNVKNTTLYCRIGLLGTFLNMVCYTVLAGSPPASEACLLRLRLCFFRAAASTFAAIIDLTELVHIVTPAVGLAVKCPLSL